MYAERFLKSSTDRHKNKYDYSKVNYTKYDSPVTIICPIHGEFEQKPTYHLNTEGCPECSKLNRMEKITDTKDLFIKKLSILPIYNNIKVVGDYINSSTPILVEDKYGKYLVTPNHLLRGKTPSAQSALNKTEYIKNRFKEVHGDKYDYSKVIYTKASDKVDIICPIHGNFSMAPRMHCTGIGCKKCGYEKLYNGFGRSDFNRAAKGKLANLYFVKLYSDEEQFYKVGITTKKLTERFYRCIYNFEIIYQESSSDANYIYDKENEIKRYLSEYKYRPLHDFAGLTECFNLKCIENFKNGLKNGFK